VPKLPCACANLRRAARVVTRIYNRELRSTGLELTQFTLLMTLEATGETTQGRLGKLLALDSTSLTRMLRLPAGKGWIAEKRGDDRRQRLLRLTRAGQQKLKAAWPNWERAQTRLRQALGETAWVEMGQLLSRIVEAARVA